MYTQSNLNIECQVPTVGVAELQASVKVQTGLSVSLKHHNYVISFLLRNYTVVIAQSRK